MPVRRRPRSGARGPVARSLRGLLGCLTLVVLAALAVVALGVAAGTVRPPEAPRPESSTTAPSGRWGPTAPATGPSIGPSEPSSRASEPSHAPSRPPSVTSAPPTTSSAPGAARAALDSLPIKGRAPKAGYSRDEFGPRWKDVDRNGCDTRNDVLARDLAEVSLKPGTGGCKVLSGTLADPYTGHLVPFVFGERTSADVQIDHVVALSDAWQKGAQALSADEREAFANDPLNLLAVDGPTNQAKGDGDAATWLPPDRTAWCPYVARQVAVKAEYGLWVTPAEHDAIERVLTRCPEQVLPGR